ncbi:dNA mismatch repair protein MutL [Clostridium sp. CAG:557]|nr:dNA mismatch repair protein MutL [Clostridium sp. CAG:557]
MAKINILDKHIAELIAAGEVVERPSSVIKELVENSIDAGATEITVEVKNGGVAYMRITDNGCGIEQDDVKNAFLRNATSKIKFEDDLNNISTLGFRGEALFSVCAVSKVELMTRTNGQEVGTHYKIEGGKETLFEDCGCSQGTTIIVRDLFYNTPARMKFLKKDSSEGSSIAKVLDRIALSHPEIAFKFIRENKLKLNTPGNGEVGSAIYAVYGKEFFSSLMELDYKLNGIKLGGFISKPTSPRSSRNMQHFFINGRYVKSRTAMVALEEAFKGSIMVQKFPACVMYISLPFDTIDVNVHPSKVEVRFIDERPIFDAIYHGVKTALVKGEKPVLQNENKMVSDVSNFTPKNSTVKATDFNVLKKDNKIKNFESKIDLPKIEKNLSEQVDAIKKIVDKTKDEEPKVFLPKKFENGYTKKLNFEKKLVSSDGKPLIFEHINNEVKTLTKNDNLLEKNTAETENDLEKVEQILLISEDFDFKIKGEVFNTYIIVEKNSDELVIIDKHAAHERMIYEELKSTQTTPLSQMFLEPVVVSLSKDEHMAIVENMDLFANSGFEIDDFGNGAVVVRAAPSYLDNVCICDIVTQMSNYILEHRKKVQSDYVEWLYENIACRAAIKAGKESKFEEMQALVKKIIKEDPRFCPHGRPVAITVKKHDIEKRFGRV